MKKLGLLLLLFLSVQSVLATSIVVLITSQYIIIGADSKRMVIDAEKGLIKNETACKIRMINTYCYAAAGITASASTGFAVDQVMKRILGKDQSITKAIKNIQQQISKDLQKELRFQQKHHPKQYLKLMESQKHLLEVVVLQVSNNIPQAYIVGFEAIEGKQVTVKSYLASCTTGCATSAPQLLLLGEYAAMENYLQTPVDTKDPVVLINQMLLTQARITPGSVGSPFSLLKMNASGMEWLDKNCN